MKKRRNQHTGFKPRVLVPVEVERKVSELAAEYGVPPTMIHQCRAPLCTIGSSAMASALLDAQLTS